MSCSIYLRDLEFHQTPVATGNLSLLANRNLQRKFKCHVVKIILGAKFEITIHVELEICHLARRSEAVPTLKICVGELYGKGKHFSIQYLKLLRIVV